MNTEKKGIMWPFFVMLAIFLIALVFMFASSGFDDYKGDRYSNLHYFSFPEINPPPKMNRTCIDAFDKAHSTGLNGLYYWLFGPTKSLDKLAEWCDENNIARSDWRGDSNIPRY